MKVRAPFPENYELLDAGGGFKLERWGEIVTIRPEHQAYFKSGIPFTEWKQLADAEFIPVSSGSLQGKWHKLKATCPDSWEFQSGPCTFHLELTSNKHVGLFPEQQIHWQELLALNSDHCFLNLFAYTGAASCYARSTGAHVTHVDSVKAMNDWGKRNMELSGLSDIRWLHDDALKFVEKEIKRGNLYDVIQMDPPAWGMGAKREKWKLEDLLPSLIEKALQILAPGGLLIVNTYSPKVRQKELLQLMLPFQHTVRKISIDELWMQSNSGKDLFYGDFVKVWK